MAETKTKVKNITDEEIRVTWDGEEFILAPGEEELFSPEVANHFRAYHGPGRGDRIGPLVKVQARYSEEAPAKPAPLVCPTTGKTFTDAAAFFAHAQELARMEAAAIVTPDRKAEAPAKAAAK